MSPDAPKTGRRVYPAIGLGRWSPFRRALHVFFVIACLVGGAMFCRKIYEFLNTIKHHELVGFAHDPLVVYALVALGFCLLLLWAYLTGQLSGVERAKYEMLERFDEQERAEGLRFPEEA
ncbi:MAG: hypothetical protein FJ299_13585 [Planctomycetes bacterium]|nr:hypothetical protein [Planctomycetota bacterium]